MPYNPLKVIAIAKAETGYLEKSLAAYKADPMVIYRKKDGAGFDNVTKYGVEMHKIYPQKMDLHAAYCDCFVDWCFMQAYGVSNARKLLAGDFDDYTVNSVRLYRAKGAWRGAGTVPELGWQIFFHKDRKPCHTGFVVDYIPSKKVIITVEANTSPGGSSGNDEIVPNGGGVFIKQYALDNPRIYGFGVPAYGKQFSYTPHWVRSGDNWYYRVGDGKNAHGWHTIDKHWFYFAEDGRMLTGPQKIGSDWYMLTTREIDASHEGACMQTGTGGNLREWIVE